MYEDAILGAIVIGMPLLIVMLRMVLRHKEKMANRDSLPQSATAGIEARLERMENAIDSIAVEMERLGEGQRFTTKLLSERDTREGAPIVARPPERVRTPH